MKKGICLVSLAATSVLAAVLCVSTSGGEAAISGATGSIGTVPTLPAQITRTDIGSEPTGTVVGTAISPPAAPALSISPLPRGALRGFVYGTGGAIAARATIELWSLDATGSVAMCRVAEEVAGDDGTFVFDDVVPGTYRVEARARGYGVGRSAPARVTAGAEAAVSPFELPPALPVHGVVLTAGGPVAGAAVRFVDAKGAVEDSGSTGEDGRFALGHVRSECGQVAVHAPGHVDVSVAVGARHRDDVQIELAPGLVLEGVIGAPRAGAANGLEVVLRRPRTPTALRAPVDAGRYRFAGLQGGAWIADLRRDGVVLARRSVTLRAPATRLDLDGGEPVVRGVVKDARGLPIAGARLAIGPSWTTSGADGRFELTAGSTGQLVATADGYAPGLVDLAGRQEEIVHVRLRGSAGIEGRIPPSLAGGGRTGVRVLVWPEHAVAPGLFAVATDGSFAASDLRAGGARVRVVIGPLRAFMTSTAGRALVTARPDVTLLPDRTVRFDPPAPTTCPGALTGSVDPADVDPTALRVALVSARGGGVLDFHSETGCDEDGQFRIDGIPAGDYELRVTEEDRRLLFSLSVSVPSGQTVHHDLRLRVVDVQGTASRRDGTVRFEALEPGAVSRSATVQDGRFELRGMTAGRYRAHYADPAGTLRRRIVTVGTDAVRL